MTATTPAPLHWIFYHADCADGFLAATITQHGIRHRWPNAKIQAIPCHYTPGIGQSLVNRIAEDAADSHVYIVDFSIDLESLALMEIMAKSIVLLDHHETALHLKDLPFATINTEFSGCQLAWKHFFPGTKIPAIVESVAWRDLGHQWSLPGDERTLLSRITSIMLMELIPRSFRAWESMLLDEAARLPMWKIAVNHFERSMALAEHHARAYHVVELQDNRGKTWTFRAISHPPQTLASDAMGHLATFSPDMIGAAWMITEHGTRWSLRAATNGPNVAEIAKAFGGGGHPQSAGFTTTTNPFRILVP